MLGTVNVTREVISWNGMAKTKDSLFGGKLQGRRMWLQARRKPWRIATDHVRLAAALDGQHCRRDHSHAVTIGKATKASEAYPPRLARCITDAFLEEL